MTTLPRDDAQPAKGGSYLRDEATGQLSPVPAASVEGPVEASVEPAKTVRKEPRA